MQDNLPFASDRWPGWGEHGAELVMYFTLRRIKLRSAKKGNGVRIRARISREEEGAEGKEGRTIQTSCAAA